MELPKYTKEQKRCSIKQWKNIGVIYHDFDELYEVYIKTMNCQHCEKKFPNNFDRCLDHNHETGMFRKIVCRGCNSSDRYIKYPNGYTTKEYEKMYRKNKEERIKKLGEKITCECGSTIRRYGKVKHETSMKHMDWWINSLD
jgi:hypothetical protein